MPVNNDFDDDEGDEQPKSATDLARDAWESLKDMKLLEKRDLSQEEMAEIADRERDASTWEAATPESADEARFYANLGLRLTRGIKNSDIRKMNIGDRIQSARRCFDMRQLLLDQPTANINYDARGNILEALPALQEELARRQREKNTVDITPEV